MTPFRRDLIIYAVWAGLGALIATTDPLTWRQLVGVLLAMTAAIKAKLSPGQEQ